MSGRSTVNIRKLKQFVLEKLNPRAALHDVLLSEKDEMPAVEFISKSQIWMTLLNRERGHQNDKV